MRKITFYCDRCGKQIPDKSIMHQLMTKLVDVLDVCTSGYAEEEEEGSPPPPLQERGV